MEFKIRKKEFTGNFKIRFTSIGMIKTSSAIILLYTISIGKIIISTRILKQEIRDNNKQFQNIVTYKNCFNS